MIRITCGYKSREWERRLNCVHPRALSAAGVDYALALGRAETIACHFAMLPYSGDTASLAGFMKSTATRAVMSATE
jgi:hypothetical protein